MSSLRWRALLVDDEILARVALRQALASHVDVEIVGECGNVQEAAQAIATLRPDLLFLDIQMPGGDGFSLLRDGVPAESFPLVVFTTAFAEHALQAFDANAIDYVLKPIDQSRFDQAMDRVRKHGYGLMQHAGAVAGDGGYAKRISVQLGERTIVIPAADIDWIRADDNYVRIHANGATYLHRETLRALYTSLDPGHFLRIHRSIVVNMNRIREVHTLFQGHAEVVLHDGTRLDLSRRFRNAARSALRLR
ncbi:MAG TPA: LytTR family DNA-binding domain-containing protein [Dyella sp.]|uniref:LytR/AlgR family response regulator transcription factor n=1 Tax=Dyella sp. TaxID=1869338 RepID=UPI002D00599C|nr:LytTR family DNA-binding domain-containing protein [Dyella sp.]HUB89292.1 LytTR family DNA-binding domain-containing protein [Dyella sp.]